MIKSRHDTAFFQRSYTSGSRHGIQSCRHPEFISGSTKKMRKTCSA
ncbi:MULTISPECIES: hypothetical protein [unclassified Rickettsia]